MQETVVDRGQRLAALRDEQSDRWRRGDRVALETILRGEPALAADDEAVLDLIYNEVMVREEVGEAPRAEDYVGRFPRLEAALRRQFDVHRLLKSCMLRTPGILPTTLA